jgi:hypothetical protein
MIRIEFAQRSLLILLIGVSLHTFAQADNPANDPDAGALLQKVSEKYKSYKSLRMTTVNTWIPLKARFCCRPISLK